MGFMLYLLSAALSSLIISTILVVARFRYSFRHICQAFVSRAKERNRANHQEDQEDNGTFLIGFFHPHCGARGGGERVLWKAIQAFGELKEDAMESRGDSNGGLHDDALARHCRNLAVAVYTIDEPKQGYKRGEVQLFAVRELFFHPEMMEAYPNYTNIMLCYADIMKQVQERFSITISSSLQMLAGCKVGTYVHYPTTSNDMLSLVWERRPTYNNKSEITSSPMVTYVKLIYYSLFAILYGLVGSLADLVMVNSSWTKGHIQYLWQFAQDIQVVFPPVDTASLAELSLSDPPRENLILSIGQFRPEKDHALQLQAFALALDMHDGKMKQSNPKLILVGSCRGEDDRERVDQLHKLARELNVEDSVEFVLNQPYSVLKDYLSRASVGIHTMWNEHFGIGVVEMMAAGLVTVAHNSGGPKSDIIESVWDFRDFANSTRKTPTGCLEGTAEEYAHAIYEIINRGDKSREVTDIRHCSRRSAERFSDQVFMKSIKETILLSPLLK
ncbi:hypothetical protein HJC23_007897 [Cyclotella cryptica]|uniref:GDP-Man:Man(3)GlcNAc(2)-PP-Dol alpha-1,2-mannosyltransferase n=1 Tax=Cyclotella cryptica TaxID=29204 RepID=A0ABD3R2W7_9STRA